MTTFAIDNTPVSVTLGNQQTYSPASGSVQKLKIALTTEELQINGEVIVRGSDGQGDPVNAEITVIATDTDVFKSSPFSDSDGIHISGFEVN